MQIISKAAQTMTSREIAELTGKDHKHILTDIRVMLEKLDIDSAGFSAQYKDSTGRTLPCFNLDRELTLTLVSGYDIPLRHRVVTRLAELENAKPLSQVQIILAQAQALVDIENRQSAVESKLKVLEAKLPVEQDYFTITGYSNYIGSRISDTQANVLGRKAAKLSRQRDIPIGSTKDPRWGVIGSYHQDILDDVFVTYFEAAT